MSSNDNNCNKQPLDLTASLPVATGGLSMEDSVGPVNALKVAAVPQNLVQSAEASTTTPTGNKLDYDGISLVGRRSKDVKPGEKNDSLDIPSQSVEDLISDNNNNPAWSGYGEDSISDYVGISLQPYPTDEKKNDSLDIPEINLPDVITPNLSHSDEASTSTPIIDCITDVIQTPYYVDKSDDETIGFLLDCAKRGNNRDQQPPPSICKVSTILRDHSVRSFIPQLVSIGPIHRENKKLKEFEWLKECYLDDLLYRCDDSTLKKTLEAFLLKVNTLIPQIRESYAGVKKNYSDVELARMMVMDGCFILEFCFKHDEENLHLPNKMQNTRIAMDLMLLENQVPFFVLQALFECSMGKQSFTLNDVLNKHLAPYSKLFRSLKPEKNSATDVVSDSTPDHVLGYLHKRYKLVAAKSSKAKHAEASKPVYEEQAAKSSNPIHAGILWCSVNFCKKPRFLLNAPGPKQLRSSFCKNFRKCSWSNCVLAPSLHAEASKSVDEELAAKSSNPTDAEEDEEGMEDTAFHSIVELDRSGMNFKPHQEDEWSMTIKFQSSHFACLPGLWKPTLLMPTLVIDDTTELILRNFIAYEQSFPKDCYCFTSYAHAMDMLIDTQEDVAKLVESKVLLNKLVSNQEAADMINEICKNMFVTDFYYTEEFKQMDKYYNRFWPKNKRIYFSNPWNAFNLLVGIIVFLATMVATIFAVLDYFR